MECEDPKGTPRPTASEGFAGNGNSAPKFPTAGEIQVWLVTYLAGLMDITPAQVEVSIPFERYGLDSSAAIGLTGDLEDWLGCELDPTLVFDYPTIEALAQHLADNAQGN